MLARLIHKSSQFHRCLSLISSSSNFVAPTALIPKPNRFLTPKAPHFSFFSTRGSSGGDDSTTSTTDLWKMSSEADEDVDSVFSMDPGNLPGLDDRNGGVMRSGNVHGGGDWEGSDAGGSDIFSEAREFGGGDEEGPAEDYTPWSFSEEGKGEPGDDLFGGVESDGEEIGIASLGDGVGLVVEKSEEEKQLEAEAKALADALKGQFFG